MASIRDVVSVAHALKFQIFIRRNYCEEIMNYATYSSPLGLIALAGNDKGLCRVDFQLSKRPLPIDPAWVQNEVPFKTAFKILDDYFADRKPDFRNLSYDLQGTAFQKAVWQFLLTIPCGCTLS